MSSVEFIYEGINTLIQCRPEEKMSEIVSRFAEKSNLDLNILYFVSEGSILKQELTFAESTKANLIKVLVNKLDEYDQEPPIINATKTKSKFIMCPSCNENILLNIDDFKINLSNCRNGHEFKNIFLNEFEENQKYDMTLIKCHDCKIKNKAITEFNEFYICLKCSKYLCPLCKSIHDKTHNIINMDKNYKCLRHNEPYSFYCKICKLNLCVQCPNEEHKNHNKIFFGDIMPNIDDINKKMIKLKNSIDLFKQNIEEIKTKLNTIVNNMEIFYKINEEIIKNFNSKERNYEILSNVNQIIQSNDTIINKLNNINEDDDIENKINNIFRIYKIMISKEEANKELIMKYHVCKNDKNVIIFGDEFVKKNKNICKIIYNNKEYELTSNFNVENINKDFLEIKLKGINYIKDMSYMFYNCSSLLSVINKDNYDFKNVTNMSSIFFGCSLLRNLSTFEQIDTRNVTNMSFLFSLCCKLDLSFIKNWDTSNVTDMSYMFSGCFKLKDLSDIKLNTKNLKYMNGMFTGCLSLISINKFDLNNVINMSQIFSCCKSINPYYIINNIFTSELPNLKDISGMFSNLNSFLNESIGYISKCKTKNIINMSYLFSFIDNLEKIENLNLDTSNAIDISNLFNGCKKLTSISNINLDTSKIIDMSGLFEGCSSLKNIKGISNINTKNVKYINSMFEDCEKLSSLPKLNWDTFNIIDMNSLFKSCIELTSIKALSNWNTENVQNMSKLFYNCKNLSSFNELDKWNTSNVTDMSSMFENCKCLSNLSPFKNWNTGNVRDMSSMFSKCKITSLSPLSNWNTKNVINMNSMFSEISFFEYIESKGSSNLFLGNIPIVGNTLMSLSSNSSSYHYLSDLSGLEKWDTSNVKDMSYMFSDCIKLTSLSPISQWNIEQAEVNGIFKGITGHLQIPSNFQKKGEEILYENKKGKLL